MNLYNNKAGEINDIIIVVIIIAVIFMIIFLVIGTGMGSQERKYTNNNISCEELRECILLDIRCLNERVDNKILMFEWEFEQKVILSRQREFYVNSCINN